MANNRYDLNENNSQGNNSATSKVIVHILLMIFTCGLYYFYWVYKVTKYLNEEYQDEGPLWPPFVHIILMIFFQPYSIIWSFLVASRFKKLCEKQGMPLFNGFDVIFAVISVILPFFNFALLDYYLEKYKAFLANSSIDSSEDDEEIIPDGADTEFSTIKEIFEPEEPHMGAVEEIRQYKELLDQGIITKEEFEAKKKQILGL